MIVINLGDQRIIWCYLSCCRDRPPGTGDPGQEKEAQWNYHSTRKGAKDHNILLELIKDLSDHYFFRLRLVRWVTMMIWSMALGERGCTIHPLPQMTTMRWALIRNTIVPSLFPFFFFNTLGRRWHWCCPALRWKSILHFWFTQWHPKGWRGNATMVFKIVILLLTLLFFWLPLVQVSDVLLDRQKERLIASRQDEYHKRQWSNLFYSPARIDPFADGK